MPIVRKVETVGDVISAFAEMDVLHSHLSIEAAQSYGKQQGLETAKREKGKAPEIDYCINPGCDYYHAIYSLETGLTRKKAGTVKTRVNYLVFTGYKTRDPHDKAIKDMGLFGSRLKTADNGFFEGHTDKEEIKFRPNCWNGGDDVTLALEETAMTMICTKLKFEKPADWRTTREALVKPHAVHTLFTLPAEAVPEPPPQPPLKKCPCGNWANGRVENTLCNACMYQKELLCLAQNELLSIALAHEQNGPGALLGEGSRL
jgi:hypothetical protein